MGTLVAVEGLDGAGKRTLVDKVTKRLSEAGLSVATRAFPRYGESVHADLGAEALAGAHGDLADSVYGMATVWASDRSATVGELSELLTGHDVVILDRYVASNAAYGAARLHQDGSGDFVTWIDDLEFGRLALPRPDLQIYLDVPVELAGERARSRQESEPSRALDAYERDGGLQVRTGAVYRDLAAAGWISPWWVVGPDTDPGEIAEKLALSIGEHGAP
ncbi:dTMP kinase [Rhodococcus sp. NPDC058521]|uniref:dTMP kinase n=1 Tax=Rhodococcus sp. NPDC058521 TaxID=3346536 RepID=UPI00364AA818